MVSIGFEAGEIVVPGTHEHLDGRLAHLPHGLGDRLPQVPVDEQDLPRPAQKNQWIGVCKVSLRRYFGAGNALKMV